MRGTEVAALLHGDELAAFVDAGFQGVEKQRKNQSLAVKWHVALRPGKRRALPDTKAGRLRERFQKLKASVRAKFDPPFHIIKKVFGHKKARYLGSSRKAAQLQAMFELVYL